MLRFCTVALAASLIFSSYRPGPIPQENAGTQKSDNKVDVLTGQNNHLVSKTQLLAYKRVNAGYGEDFAFDLKCTVKSYTFVLARKNGSPYMENVSGNRVTPAMEMQFQSVKPGDLIIVTNVEVAGQTGIMHLNGFTLKVH